jgi:phosphoserine phosphatase
LESHDRATAPLPSRLCFFESLVFAQLLTSLSGFTKGENLMNDHSQDRTVIVFSSSDLLTAEVVANALRGEGIVCSVLNANQGGYTGLGVTSVEVMVREADADRARAYITKTGN